MSQKKEYYRRYITEKIERSSFKFRWSTGLIVYMVFGLFAILLFAYNPTAKYAYVCLGLWLLFPVVIAVQYYDLQGKRRVAERGELVNAILIQANYNLFQRGSSTHYCLVVFSFAPEHNADSTYLCQIANQIYALKIRPSLTLDFLQIGLMAANESASHYRRRQLPNRFTGGATVYVADLLIDPACLPAGYLRPGERVLPCLAEPGKRGGIELLPWQALSDGATGTV